MKSTISTFVFILLSAITFGQVSEECYAKKDFLIIKSTKDYKQALLTAQKATKAIGINLNLRSLAATTDTLIGLTMPLDSCSKYTSDKICYVARGRWDDGKYISIEYSNAYDGFAKGYYIVVVASGSVSDKAMKTTLKEIKTKYPDAYVKTSKVFMCCMH